MILGKCHTWRAWGSRICKKQIDFFMGPRDLHSTTCWDHFPVEVKIDGKELRVKMGKKGWARWIDKTEGEKKEVPRIGSLSGRVSGMGG